MSVEKTATSPEDLLVAMELVKIDGRPSQEVHPLLEVVRDAIERMLERRLNGHFEPCDQAAYQALIRVEKQLLSLEGGCLHRLDGQPGPDRASQTN